MTSPRAIVLCRYHYDPLDRLIGHAPPDVPERQRFYCKSRLATEIQGAMRYSIVQHGEQLLAQQRSEGDASDTTLLATDQQRSVLQTLKADHPPQPIAYSPYGHRPIESGLLSLLGFNGERPDPLTGCYLLGNGYRAFNPVLMRFNSPDAWSPFGQGGVNPYAYCLGNPINRKDPTGHTASIFGIVIAKNLARRAVARLTGRVHIYESIFGRIKSDVPVEQALRARDRIASIIDQTDFETLRNRTYEADYQNPVSYNRPPTTLQNLSADTILSVNIPMDTLSPFQKSLARDRLQFLPGYEHMLRSIDIIPGARRYNPESLARAVEGTLSFEKKLVNQNTARAYQAKLLSIRNPKHAQLTAEKQKLLEDNFSDIGML